MPAIDNRSVTSACAARRSEPASAASSPWYSGPLCAASRRSRSRSCARLPARWKSLAKRRRHAGGRSEEHTSELQSRRDLVCRLLLEKKKKKEQAPIVVLQQKKKKNK